MADEEQSVPETESRAEGTTDAQGAEAQPVYDRVVESTIAEIPEIDDRLFNVMVAALNEAKQKMEAGEEVVPFTALAVKDNLFLETHPGEDADQCFAYARHTVQNASGADAYALCYDGYVDTDEGTKDALIAEGGMPGHDEGYAVGYLYNEPEAEDGVPEVVAEPVYIGPAPNFMIFTREHVYDEEDETAPAEEENGSEEA